MQEIPQDILNKSAEGDLRAFEEIYKMTAGFVYNVALHQTHNREDAQEVVQEVFLTVYHKLKDFRRQSAFKTWIYRITVNCAINYWKKNARIKNREVVYDENRDARAIAPEVSANITTQDQGTKVQQLLETLDSDQKACVILRNLEGLSYQQIAEVLRVNINTVRSRLKRAREKLLAERKKAAHENV